MKKELKINFPHCDKLLIIIELNSKIFRCDISKSNRKQINPHPNKNICYDLTTNNLIYGSDFFETVFLVFCTNKLSLPNYS